MPCTAGKGEEHSFSKDETDLSRGYPGPCTRRFTSNTEYQDNGSLRGLSKNFEFKVDPSTLDITGRLTSSTGFSTCIFVQRQSNQLTLSYTKDREALHNEHWRDGVAMDTLARISSFSAVSYEVYGKQHRDLGSIEAGLQNRSVTVPSDEPLLIANLLDLDVVDILNGPCPLAECAGFGCDHS